MKTELLYLVWTTVFTGLMWIPYIIDRTIVRGAKEASATRRIRSPARPGRSACIKAHYNAVENLVLFATLVLTAQRDRHERRGDRHGQRGVFLGARGARGGLHLRACPLRRARCRGRWGGSPLA